MARTNFKSDNVTGACPEVMEALMRANQDEAVPSYGGTVGGTLDDPDPSTLRMTELFCNVFETEMDVFPVATGTAANMLALATVTPPYGVVYSPAGSHAASDECNAPESAMSGAKFIAVPTEEGKVIPEALDELVTINKEASVKYFHSLPAAVSITNVTEAGTNYSPAETAAIGAVAKKHNLVLHLDGARFGNAVAATGATPAELTWKAGVDVMSFGCTKNGAMAAEAVLFFNRSLTTDFRYRFKRAGQLWCKMRFLSAQIEGYLADDCWLKNARHANNLALKLARGLEALPGLEVAPVHANEVFVFALPAFIEGLRNSGHEFLDFAIAGDARRRLRLVTAWSSTAEACDLLIADATKLATNTAARL